MKMKKGKYIIGIDEAGRGSLAGPVVVAAVVALKDLRFKIKDLRTPLRDSKKLTPRQREIWFKWIQAQTNAVCPRKSAMYYAIANISPKIIDKINISNAANLAATRALFKLVNSDAIASLLTKNEKIKIFLDGGLYLKKNSIRINQLNQHKLVSTIIKGDEKIPAIMLASIIAKVSRDRLMEKLHKKYPKYGFAQHKGYGTKKHIRAMKKYGLSPIHRRSFRIR